MIRRELPIFLVVGVLAVLMDFAAYRLVVWAGIDVHLGKAVGFLSGTVFAYFANGLWTFGHTPAAQGSAWRFAVLYLSTLTVNVQVNALVLSVCADWSVAMPLAFLIATATSSTLNFFGMKFFVFRPAQLPEPA